MKTNKTLVPGEITNEFYKYLTVGAKTTPLRLLHKVWELEDIPNSWCVTYLHMMYKKVDPENPDNYRGITLASTNLKLFTNILSNRLNTCCGSQDILPENIPLKTTPSLYSITFMVYFTNRKVNYILHILISKEHLTQCNIQNYGINYLEQE